MKLHQQYLQLKSFFAEEEQVEVTLQQLADLWGCTTRNASLLIRRLEERGWISWHARRGRGRRSTLVFRAAEETLADHLIHRAVSRKDMLVALEQLASRATSPRLQARLEAELLNRFGFRRESSGKQRIDVLRIPVRQAPRTLDPLEMNLLTESFLASHLYDPLIRLADGKPVPHLAHAWEVDEQGLRWTFRLRKGLYFHHGKQLDSGDAAFTLNRLRQAPPGTLYRPLFRKIQQVEVLDDRTFAVELETPLVLLPHLLATGRAAVLPADLGSQQPGRFRRQPVGTGPFKLVEAKSRLIELAVFSDYFRERAHLDRVEIWVLPQGEPSPSGNHGEPADRDLFRIIHNPREAQNEEPAWQQIGSDVTVSKFLTVNNRSGGPLSDPVIRSPVLARLAGIPADVPVLDRPLRLSTISFYEKDARQVAERLIHNGVPVDVSLIEPDQFSGEQRLQADLLFFTLIRDRESLLRQYDLFLSMTDHLDDGTALSIRLALDKIGREPDRDRRERLMADVEQRLIRERLLVIWQERAIRTAVHQSVGGAETNAQGWVDLRKLWFG